ncbi:MAG: dTDP-4-amino-4,6-dideoxygalactose transaminase, partial [Bacteroidetes bacterium]|nr:dTDP-4-amino-4,6-dideoxygalactose transaminase [Bacteroidota bacterium]
MEPIVFNKPFLSGSELEYIRQAVESGRISGNGAFSKKCQSFLENRYGFRKVLLTTSCTDALEMAAILCDIRPGDEVIAPSFTFVSTVNAFVLRGARVVFCDVREDYPVLDEDIIRGLITPRTKAIVVTHYAGVSCKMDALVDLAERNGLFLVEDAAQAIDSFYKGRPLGTFGHFSAFSFHETKNVSAGEGGMIAINDERFIERAEIIHEKGTNRTKFFRGEVDKYSWVDVGSSFLPSDVTAAFLFAQLENLEKIQGKRKSLWEKYLGCLAGLRDSGRVRLPELPAYATNNGHLFYILMDSREQLDEMIAYLSRKGIMAVFHYVPLHTSEYYLKEHERVSLPNTERFSACLLRLPMYFDLTEE